MRRLALLLILACRSEHLDGKLVHRDAPPIDARVVAPMPSVPDGCGDQVIGKPFRGARMLCLAASTMALVATSLDEPAHAEASAARIAVLLEDALSADAQKPFAGTGRVKVGDTQLPASVLYRGLLGIMLAGLDRIATPALKWSALANALATSLSRDLARGFIASYPGGIWPCDHAPAAAFLRLRHDPAAQQLLTRITDAMAREPRTTPIAFASAYLLPAEPVLARSFAEHVVARCDRVPVAACFEWTDRGHGADAASGPIVQGYSVGATALAIVATRALPDRAWNEALLATASLAGAAGVTGSLERALLAWGKTARTW